jgi:hypothetical protein
MPEIFLRIAIRNRLSKWRRSVLRRRIERLPQGALEALFHAGLVNDLIWRELCDFAGMTHAVRETRWVLDDHTASRGMVH